MRFFQRPLCLLAAALIISGTARAAEIRIGVLAPLGSDAAVHSWTPVVAVLNRAISGHHFRLVVSDLSGLSRAVRDGTVEFVITNSGHYVVMEREFGITRIVTLEQSGLPSPAGAIGSAVIALHDRADLASLADLGGRRLAVVSREAFGGFQVAWRELLSRGIDPDTAGAVVEVGYPMQRVVAALRESRADAGVIKACLLEQMIASGDARPDEFKVLSPMLHAGFPCRVSTRLYPDWPLAVLRHTPRLLAKQVAAALLTNQPGMDEPGWTIPIDYRPVYEMMEELHIGPYAYLNDWTFTGVWRRYWYWVLAVLAVLVVWAVHTVRAEHLVQLRTRALREALSAREKSEAEAREHREKLEHLSRLSILGEMSSTIAHELNQPLAAIGNFAQGMQRRIAMGRLDPAPFSDACREIAEQADLAGGILHRIRDFSRKLPASRATVDLVRVIDEAVALFRGMQVDAPRVAVQSPGGTATVWADVLQLQQVLLNLLKNALDALRQVSADARRIEITLGEEEGGYWRVAVRDNGQGLTEADFPRLFQAFFTTKTDGIGLGLSISQSIVEAHGGRLFVRSNAPGPGLTVGFTLPKAMP